MQSDSCVTDAPGSWQTALQAAKFGKVAPPGRHVQRRRQQLAHELQPLITAYLDAQCLQRGVPVVHADVRDRVAANAEPSDAREDLMRDVRMVLVEARGSREKRRERRRGR